MQRKLDREIENYIFSKIGMPLDYYASLTPTGLSYLVAKAAVGIKESGGDNKGLLVESIQKTIGGAEGESWCMSSQQMIEAFVEKYLGVKSSLFISESCMEVAKNSILNLLPSVGDIAIWQHYDNGKPTIYGHTGRVLSVDFGKGTFDSSEGNTSSGVGIERNGDGWYRRSRSLELGHTGNMRLVGYITNVYEAE